MEFSLANAKRDWIVPKTSVNHGMTGEYDALVHFIYLYNQRRTSNLELQCVRAWKGHDDTQEFCCQGIGNSKHHATHGQKLPKLLNCVEVLTTHQRQLLSLCKITDRLQRNGGRDILLE